MSSSTGPTSTGPTSTGPTSTGPTPTPGITGATRLATVIGHPIAHSLSPTLFNAAFAATGLDWVYLAFDVAAGQAASALDAVRTLGIGGVSVTTPHKADVAAAVDELDPAAAALGAVNCVVPAADGRLVGHNTDGVGFLAGVRADLGIEVGGRHVVVLGAGGAARAIVAAVAAAGAARVSVVNRDPGRAEVAAALGGDRGVVAGAEVLGAADLVVNATSVRMAGVAEGAVPADPATIAATAAVVDIVYHPLQTPFLRGAGARGLPTANGVGMLIGQAAAAFELWTGSPAPVAAMRAAADVVLVRR